MKVSILIHNLNRAQILERCLASVAAQTYRPVEVVILDAGSIDESNKIIDQNLQIMLGKGMEAKSLSCLPMGVAASRNFAAGQASGELLCAIDNDATFAFPDSIDRIARLFKSNNHLAVVSARIVSGDTSVMDPLSWVYRRSKKKWAGKQFKTFTFTGAGFCIRTKSFWEVGGFWDHLKYSREEEELSLALINKGWDLLYCPKIVVKHYPDPRGRLSLINRRYVELTNGLLIYWRRFPLPIALLAICARICSISVKIVFREKVFPTKALHAVSKSIQEWKRYNLQRVPVSFNAVWKYVYLHFSGGIREVNDERH